jgi:hypothetical protein
MYTRFDVVDVNPIFSARNEIGIAEATRAGAAQRIDMAWSQNGRSMFHSASYIMSALIGLDTHHCLLEPAPLRTFVSACCTEGVGV